MLIRHCFTHTGKDFSVLSLVEGVRGGFSKQKLQIYTQYTHEDVKRTLRILKPTFCAYVMNAKSLHAHTEISTLNNDVVKKGRVIP